MLHQDEFLPSARSLRHGDAETKHPEQRISPGGRSAVPAAPPAKGMWGGNVLRFSLGHKRIKEASLLILCPALS